MEDTVLEFQKATGRTRDRLFAEIHDSMIGLIVQFSKRRTGYEEDLQQAGRIGLLEAATEYDPAVEVPFYPYARKRIRWAIASAARPVTRQHRDESYPGEDLDLAVDSHTEEWVELKNRVNALPEPVRTVALATAEGLTTREIGKRVGLSHARVAQIQLTLREGGAS